MSTKPLHSVFAPDVNEDIRFLIVDLFCGAGGTTTGFAKARVNGKRIAKVIACINHDAKAIKSHWLNHPDVQHFEEDIRSLNLTELVRLVNYWRAIYPNAKVILWASLECTNYSKAKGGMARDADSRTLAHSLHMQWCSQTNEYIKGDSYIQLLQPDYVQIENVVEFMSWGPMRIKAKKHHSTFTELCLIKDNKTGKTKYGWEPISRKNGQDWMQWCQSLCNLGYTNTWKEINSANIGAYTSRNRLFGCFTAKGLPLVWPQATHQKQSGVQGKTQSSCFTNDKQPWKPVKEVLDFSDEGESIFGRKKDLSPKTYERVYEGLVKFVAGGKEAYMIKYMGNDKTTGINKGKSLDEPCVTIPTSNRLGLVQTIFISKYYSGNPSGKNTSIESPAGTITCIDSQALINAQFLTQRNDGKPSAKIISVEGPARTLTSTGGNQDLVQACFISSYYGTGNNNNSVDNPASTITTKARQAIINAKYLLNYHHSSNANDITEPAPTITCADKLSLIQAEYFFDKQYGSGGANAAGIDTAAGSILANDKHCLVQAVPFISRQFSDGSKNSSVDEPSGALLTVPKVQVVCALEAFIMPTNYDNKPFALTVPLSTITANRKWHYLVNPSWYGNPHTTEVPCPVIVARQDKAPLYLVCTVTGEIAIRIDDSDCEPMRRIKEFMILYRIIDIKMRMLKVKKLLKIQGFPDDYALHGTQTDQKKFIGNSVHPLVPEAWVISLYHALPVVT